MEEREGYPKDKFPCLYSKEGTVLWGFRHLLFSDIIRETNSRLILQAEHYKGFRNFVGKNMPEETDWKVAFEAYIRSL